MLCSVSSRQGLWNLLWKTPTFCHFYRSKEQVVHRIIFWKPLSVDKDPRPCRKDDQSTTLTFFMLIWTLYHELWKFMGKREQWKMFLKQCPSFAKFTNCHLLLNSIYNKATVSRINIKVSITPLILLLQVAFTSGPVVL